MPVNVILLAEERGKNKTIAWLCDGVWKLAPQIEELERWLIEQAETLPKGSYVADVGFAPRPDAYGGGAVLSVRAMKAMVKADMVLFLSEYSPSEESD